MALVAHLHANRGLLRSGSACTASPSTTAAVLQPAAAACVHLLPTQRHHPVTPLLQHHDGASSSNRSSSRSTLVCRCSQREGGGADQQQRLEASPQPEESRNAPAKAPAGEHQQQPSSNNHMVSEVDRRLMAVWEDVKRDMRRDVDPELAQVLDTMSYEELTSSNSKRFFQKLADKLLGPTMAALGLNMDPLEFLFEMIKVATFLQFVACGLAWYGSQGLAHADAGDAAKATLGLAIGCLTRPAFKVEHLLYPVYNSILQLFVPNGAFLLPSSTKEEVQGTANRLGVTLAVACLLPQLLWGWDGQDTALLVAPLCGGWIVFDITYMMAMLLILSREGDSSS